MRRKQNFEIVFGFKNDTAVLTFSLRFLSTPFPSLFGFESRLISIEKKKNRRKARLAYGRAWGEEKKEKRPWEGYGKRELVHRPGGGPGRGQGHG